MPLPPIIDGPALAKYLGGVPNADLCDLVASTVSDALAVLVVAPAETEAPDPPAVWPNGIITAALSIAGRVYKDMTATGGSVQLDADTAIEVFSITSNVMRRSEAFYVRWRETGTMIG